eukprot:350013-Chlamydomonas_euryale.AAC.3
MLDGAGMLDVTIRAYCIRPLFCPEACKAVAVVVWACVHMWKVLLDSYCSLCVRACLVQLRRAGSSAGSTRQAAASCGGALARCVLHMVFSAGQAQGLMLRAWGGGRLKRAREV